MGNKKSKIKNRGGALDCQYPSGDKTRSSKGVCPSGSTSVTENVKKTVAKRVVQVKSPVVTCKKNGVEQSFLVSELEKKTIMVDNKEEERPLCPPDYYFDNISKTPVTYQEMIPQEEAMQILNDYQIMAKKKNDDDEEISGGNQKRTFKRRKQRKYSKRRKTNKK